MSMASLSLEQAPPITVPFRFFLSAPLFLLLAAIALLAAGPAALESRWNPYVLGTTHLITLGCMSMVMNGAMLQLLPVLAGSPVPNPRLMAWVVHSPLLAGAALLSGGLYFDVAVLVRLAIPVLGFAFAAFLGIAVYSLLRAPGRNASTHAMLLALAALSITVGLGMLLAAGVSNLLNLSLQPLTALHVSWGLFGWTTMLVIGVAYQVVPMFQLTAPYSRVATRWLGGTLFALVLLWSSHMLLPEPAASVLSFIAACGLAACISTFAIITLQLQYKRRRRVPDISMEFWRIGLFSLLAAVVLWLAGQFSVALVDSAPYALELGMLFIIGFALSVIQGMIYKIVPFLIWFHLQGKLPIGKTPNMKDIIPDNAARWHWRAHLASLLLLLVSAIWPRPWVYVAGCALLLAAMLLLTNLIRAWNRYLRTMAKI